MLDMYFSFFNDESIRGFTSTFLAICYATSRPFIFPYRSKRPPLDILKFIVDTLRVSIIKLHSSKLMKIDN